MIWSNYWNKVKKYFSFSSFEIRAFVISVFVLAFVWSFDKWGGESFDFVVGLKNFVFSLLLVGSALFVHHAGQRLWGLRLGFRVEQKLWWYGIVFSLILVFVSFGKIKFLGVSATMIYMLYGHRLGAFRYGLNLKNYAAVCLAGPIANILFGTFFKQLANLGVLSASVADPIFRLNLVFAAWNLLPVPPLDGSKILFSSRLFFAFLFGTVVSYVLLIFLFGIYSYFFAFLLGILCWFLFYVFIES